jgi:hypothetical protein
MAGTTRPVTAHSLHRLKVVGLRRRTTRTNLLLEAGRLTPATAAAAAAAVGVEDMIGTTAIAGAEGTAEADPVIREVKIGGITRPKFASSGSRTSE